ncbi:MAG: DL-endopeptidase inhibitor IseA family protein [Oscillospiraceae bacterium]
MSKFKKYYNDTFNNIHAPDRVKKEVLNMAKNLNQNQDSREDNNIITTQVEEVSRHSHMWRNVATSLAVVGICFVGVVFFNKFNDDIPSTNTKTDDIEITTVTNNTDITNDSNILDYGKFEEMFGVDLSSVYFEYLQENNGIDMFKCCASNENILKILDSFNISSWEESSEVIPNNNEVDVQKHLDLKTNNNMDLTINFFTLKNQDTFNGSDTLQVRVINEVASIDKCYIVKYSTYDAISKAINQNNSIRFDLDPNSSVYVQDTQSELVTTINDKDNIDAIGMVLFDTFQWKYTNDLTMVQENSDSIPKVTKFEYSHGVGSYDITLYRYDTCLYANITVDTPSYCIGGDYELTSSNLEQDYNNLISLIKNTSSTVDNTISQIVSTVTTITPNTTKVTTSTAQSTTPKSTTAPITTTTPVVTTTKPVTTTTPTITTTIPTTTELENITTSIEDIQSIISLDIPNSRMFCNDLVYNMTDDNARPQFFDEDLQQYFAEAYSIEQWSAFGCQFKYDDNDGFLVEYEDHNEYYSRITNTEFKTVEDIRNYFKQYFTDDYINKNINMSHFVEQDGKVYGINGARGGNMEYIGHSFVLDSQSSDRIEFHAEVYYYTGDGILDLAYFHYQEPTDMPHDTEICNYVLVKTNDGWRFDTLETMV